MIVDNSKSHVQIQNLEKDGVLLGFSETNSKQDEEVSQPKIT